MAFTVTIFESQPIGSVRLVIGKFVNDGGSTGGDIKTGLNTVYAVTLGSKGSSILANQAVYNETLPLTNAGGTVTIVTTANETGSFIIAGI